MSRQWIGLGLLLAASFMFLNSDCGKDPDEATASFAQFSYEIFGNKLAVTNKSLFSNTYEWDFGNGITSIDERPTPGPESYIHFEEFGTYNVRLIATGMWNKDTIEKEINIQFQPRNDFPGKERNKAISWQTEDNFYYGLGRDINDESFLLDMWQYDFDNDNWTQLSNAPLEGFAKVQFHSENKGYVLSAKQNNEFQVAEFDFSTQSWNLHNSFIQGMNLTPFNFYQYAFTYMDEVHFLWSDNSTETLILKYDLNNHTIDTLDSEIYFDGRPVVRGDNINFISSEFNYIYNMSDNELYTDHGFWPNAEKKIDGYQMIEVHEDTLHVMGGFHLDSENKEVLFPLVKVFSLSGSTTTRLFSGSGCHANYGSSFRKGDKAIVLGGIVDPTCHNEVWEYRFNQ